MDWVCYLEDFPPLIQKDSSLLQEKIEEFLGFHHQEQVGGRPKACWCPTGKGIVY